MVLEKLEIRPHVVFWGYTDLLETIISHKSL